MPDWFEKADPHLTEKMRQVREIAAAQRQLGPAFEKAVAAFFAAARQALLDSDTVTAQANFDAWPSRDDVWRDLLREFVFGIIEGLFETRFRGQIRGRVTVDIDALAAAYLDEVWQRLADWPDQIFTELRSDYTDAVQEGLSDAALDRRLAELLDINAPSKRRRAEMDRLQRTADDPNARDSVRRQARQRLAALRADDSRRGKRWWPAIAELTRTHALAALNAGTTQGADAYAEATGEQRFKVWWSAEDQRVRPAHVAAHGQVQPTGDRFQVGGFPMRFPGDPRAPADLTANCRCSVLSVSAAEADRIRERARTTEGVTMTTTTAATTVEPTADPDPQPAPENERETESVLAAGIPEGATTVGWRGVLAPIDKRSPDGRVLARPEGNDAVLHRTLPLPLLYQERTGPGHDGAVIVGNIQRVWVDGDAVMGEGTFDLGNPTAREVVRQIDGGYHRWVSITHDPDADYDFKYYRGDVEVDPSELMLDDSDVMFIDLNEITEVRVASNWRLSDATLVATPAFDEAAIELLTEDAAEPEPAAAFSTESTEETAEEFAEPSAEKRNRAEKSGAAMEGGRFPIENREDLLNAIRAVGRARPNTDAERAKVRRHIMRRARALGLTELIPDSWNSDGSLKSSQAATLIAAGGRAAWCERVADAVPLEPPSDWFVNPELPAYTKPTITDEGRAYGHFCPWDVTHAGDPRTRPPRHGTDLAYAKFHRHPVRVDGGGRIMTGPLATGGHAEFHARSIADVMRHYDQPEHVLANVIVGEDEHGIWFSGALRPGVTPLQINALDQYFVSGDWRNGELLAACVVSVPGFHKSGALIDAIAAAADEIDEVPVVADVTPRVQVEDGEVVALVAAGLLSAPVLADHRRAQPAPLPGGVDPEEWGQRIGRGMFSGWRQAEDEARRQAAAERAEQERAERVAEFRRRVGPPPPPPAVLELRRRVLGDRDNQKVGA